MEKKVVLSIAGSDPSGGAGIQADLKSFSSLNIHGVTVITCITSQNTMHVKNIYPLPLEILQNQIDTLYEDFDIEYVKTGMLFNEEIIRWVAKNITGYNVKAVVDPVMTATSGDRLSQNTFINALKRHLLPKGFLITANIPEASELTGMQIETIDDIKKACRKLSEFGVKYILIKGGHLETPNAVDVFYDGNCYHEFSLPRILNKKAHGSGCSYAALITGLLALGETPCDAVKKAKYAVWSMIYTGYSPGKGSDVINQSCTKTLPLNVKQEYVPTWIELREVVEELVLFLPRYLIPEVGMNFSYAIENATKPEHICAIDGRIIKTKKKVKQCGGIKFGASSHVASILLSAMSFDENIRSVLNIRYSKKNIEICRQAGFSIGFFDRKNEPKDIPSTMEWGTRKAIDKIGFVPDIIYDEGGVGKEPMIRILGENPKNVLLKLKKLLKFDIRYKNTKCL
jgi:hydroxymethylpyrimidine/phosphomethylpyrimidine kinase